MGKLKAKRRKNPVSAGQPVPFPHMGPDYPIKYWVIPRGGERVQTVTLQQEDGRYLSAIVSEPSIRCTGKTQREAEKGVLGLFREHHNPPVGEDEADHCAILEAEHDRTMSLKEFLKRAG
ncbi:MAG: hypothetical protein AAB225_06120 [Acidobacteriota bacterium]